ncbi:MAG: DUF4440 domain-containing protein [Ginsengibacter sp.]
MKIFLLLIFCLLINIFIGCDTHVLTDTTTDEKQLLLLEYNWLKAEFSLDTTYLSSIMDTTFTDISEEGIHNKNQSLKSMYSSISQRLNDSVVIDSFNFENAVVNMYENTAVVIFTVHTYGKNKKVVTGRKTRFYDVWIKRKKEWKVVSSQRTMIK